MVPDDDEPVPEDDELDELDPQAAVTAASAMAATPTQTRGFGTKCKLTVPFVTFVRVPRTAGAKPLHPTDVADWIFPKGATI